MKKLKSKKNKKLSKIVQICEKKSWYLLKNLAIFNGICGKKYNIENHKKWGFIFCIENIYTFEKKKIYIYTGQIDPLTPWDCNY